MIYDRSAATQALDGLDLGPLNREFAEYWLSVWHGGALPARGAINPAKLVKFLPGLAIMDLHADDSIRFRLAGHAYRAAFGFDPSHHDLLSLTPAAQRADRLARCRDLANGTVAAGLRLAALPDGRQMIAQDVMLPLGGTGEDGARSWLFHSSWRPGASDWVHRLPENAVGMVESYTARRLA